MDKNLRLLLFTHARSGSSSLYQMLALHPQLHILEDPFNEVFARCHPDKPNYLDLVTDKASPRATQIGPGVPYPIRTF